MGSKYTTLSSSGYNSSPPADDGSQTASNLITWSGIKSKLADPPKNLADAINTALVTAFDYSVRQISSSDNTVASDHMKCVEIAPTVTTAVTVSLGDAATMTNNYRVFVKNSSAVAQTVGRVTGGDTIDAVAANYTLAPGSAAFFQTNSAASGYIAIADYSTPGQIRFPSTQNPSSNANTLDNYAEGSFTATLTGVSGTVTGTANYTIIGNVVTIDLPGLSGTSNAATMTVTGAPNAIKPATQKGFIAITQDNGAASVVSSAAFTTGGVLQLFGNASNGTFTSSGTKGYAAFSVTYTLT